MNAKRVLGTLHSDIALAHYRAAEGILALRGGNREEAVKVVRSMVGHGIDSETADILEMNVRHLANEAEALGQ